MGSGLSKATAIIICAYIIPPLFSQSSNPILTGRPSSAFSTNSQFTGKDDQYCHVSDVVYQNAKWDEDTCWCPIADDCSDNPYMQADLGKVYQVTHTAVSPCEWKDSEWITSYKVRYRLTSSSTWQWYNSGATLPGNSYCTSSSDCPERKTTLANGGFAARYVRIYSVATTTKCSTNAEIYGHDTFAPTPNPTKRPTTPKPTAKPTPIPTRQPTITTTTPDPTTTTTSTTTLAPTTTTTTTATTTTTMTTTTPSPTTRVPTTSPTKEQEEDREVDNDGEDDDDDELESPAADEVAPVHMNTWIAIAGVSATLFCLCLCVIFVCYKMRKADEEEVEDMCGGMQSNDTGNPSGATGEKKMQIYYNKESDHSVYTGESGKVRKWFEVTVGYPQYADVFIENGYDSMHAIMCIQSKAEIKEIGVSALGHQSLLLNEIQKLNKNTAGQMDGDGFATTEPEMMQSDEWDHEPDVYEDVYPAAGVMPPPNPMEMQMHMQQQQQQQQPMIQQGFYNHPFAPQGAHLMQTDAIQGMIAQQNQRMMQMHAQMQQSIVEEDIRTVEGGGRGASFASDVMFADQEKYVKESRR